MTDQERHRRSALITGIAGQDGHYLARHLSAQGYEVHGLALAREAGAVEEPAVVVHRGDVTDAEGLAKLVARLAPDEIYNLAAQSHVSTSFDRPAETEAVNAAGAVNVLEAAQRLHGSKSVRVYQASTSEMFGGLPGTAPQNEHTAFAPRSPYAVAKVAAFEATVRYRTEHGLFACNGILFNHESPRRPPSYVTRKITLAAARIKLGLQDELRLGNLDVQRDWGFAGDYVEAMWLMLQQPEPDDFVIATGESRSIREFLDRAFGVLGLEWKDYVKVDPKYFRPAEVEVVRGDASKAREQLGWTPSTSFQELVEMMVASDLAAVRHEVETADEA